MTPPPPRPPPPLAGRTGVAGVLSRVQESRNQMDNTMSSALRDLTGLMDSAREMVALAVRLRATMLSTGNAAGDVEGEQELEAWMLDLGISAPVTKQSAGAVYHQQLSRELGAFLQAPLRRAGGMLTLPEAFCLFNRARGAELVSPDDMLKVCKLWASLGVPLTLRQFDSGLIVVQSSSHSDDEVCARLSAFVLRQSGVGAADVARELAVTLTVAQEHLLLAEQKGALCRDEGKEGLRFYSTSTFLSF